MSTKIDKYTRLSVTKDTDGGVNVRDETTGLIVSVIGTHPDSNGPQGVVVEVYQNAGRFVERWDWTHGSLGQDLRPGQVQSFLVMDGDTPR